MIPVVVRSTEEMLKLVPNELREASYALGVPKWKTIVRIVLPTALLGHRHRRPARPGPRHGRDRSAADPGRLLAVHQHEPLQRQHGGPAAHDQQRPPAGAGSRGGAGLGGRPHTGAHRAGAQHRRPGSSPASARSGSRREPDGQAHRRQGPQRLLRQLQGRRGRLDDRRAPLRHGLHRPVRLRQVDLPAHAEPHARGHPRRPRRGQRHARRRRPLLRQGRPGQRPPHRRHGLPAAQPVPDDVDLRQRRGRACGSTASAARRS